MYVSFMLIISIVYALATVGILPVKWSINGFFLSSIGLALVWMFTIVWITFGGKNKKELKNDRCKEV